MNQDIHRSTHGFGRPHHGGGQRRRFPGYGERRRHDAYAEDYDAGADRNAPCYPGERHMPRHGMGFGPRHAGEHRMPRPDMEHGHCHAGERRMPRPDMEHGHCHAGERRMQRHAMGFGDRATFRRRFMTKDERVALLEAYLHDLQNEAKAVEERLAALQAPEPPQPAT